MSKIVTFSGWGQRAAALDVLAPKAEHIRYCDYGSLDELFDKVTNTNCDLLIGWSLGGQLALRAVDAGVIKPEKLVLLSTPFQFIESDQVPSGMHKNTFMSFKNGFIEDPSGILSRFTIMVGRNDRNAKKILRELRDSEEKHHHWLYWLEELENFSCYNLSFKKLPDTLVVHGQEDTIVDVSQSSLFLPFIKKCNIEIIPFCGHAPHLHDPKGMKSLIEDFLRK